LAVFSLDLDKMNADGPSMELRVGFSASLSTLHGTFCHQTDAMEEKSEALMIFMMTVS
jgi:hypothetical protein